MARTNSPHPRSFLAFACQAALRIRVARNSISVGVPSAAIWEVSSGLGLNHDPYFDYLAARADRYQACLVDIERARLLSAGFSADDLATPQMQKEIERTIASQGLLDLYQHEIERLKTAGPKRGDKRDEDDERFPRDVVVDVIAGTHFASNYGPRSRTAVELNHGIPTKDGAQRMTPFEVRGVLDAFARRFVSDLLGRGVQAAQFAAWDAIILRDLWNRTQADPGLRRLQCIDQIDIVAADGRFWSWLREAEVANEVPTLSRERRGELLKHGLAVFTRYVEKADAAPGQVVKFRRKTAAYSHATAR